MLFKKPILINNYWKELLLILFYTIFSIYSEFKNKEFDHQGAQIKIQ